MQAINDVTGLNRILVSSIASPESTEEVASILRGTNLPVSIGGGHCSMGGQTASPATLHLEMTRMNRVLLLDPMQARIRVQAGVRWRQVQRAIDPHGLAVKVMQTYANFTVGGTLSVNAHGRYIGFGPVVSSVLAIKLVLADGTIVEASRTENGDMFRAAIGGYGAVGVVCEVELELVPNTRVERQAVKMTIDEYAAWFEESIAGSSNVVFHNFDLYPPHFGRGRAVTWTETMKPASSPRLRKRKAAHPLARYLMWAITETPGGKARREFLYDPLIYARRPVHWRNYEAGYDVAELEPADRTASTYVLQEYFVPHSALKAFAGSMAGILRKYGVNAVNVSIRHASADRETVLSWANGAEGVFCFVLYYKQGTTDLARERVAIWTRELIDAALAVSGTYYLPYQIHATADQFHRAYPRAQELFELKRRVDPNYRLRGALWDRYYSPSVASEGGRSPTSLFHAVYDDTRTADRFHGFLSNVFDIVPSDAMHALVKRCATAHDDDETIYRAVQAGLPDVTPRLSMLTHALPSLARQKGVMGRQTAQLIGGRLLHDYVEIGTTGRYVGALHRHLNLAGETTLVHDVEAGYSPVDIVERGGVRKAGAFVPLGDYAPLALPDCSADLVSCFVGLHHMDPERLTAFLASIARVLRPGGVFVLREHDVRDESMGRFASLAHTVFNAGLGESWGQNKGEPRHFRSVDEWIARVEAAGLRHSGPRLSQQGDPTENLLMAFVKPGATE